MAINSSVFSSLANLDAYVSDSTPFSESISMVNLNNSQSVAVGEFLIAYLDYYNGLAEFENGTHTMPYLPADGHLSTQQTGLNQIFYYNKIQTGYVKMKVGPGVKKLEVREYYRTSSKTVIRIFEVLADHTQGAAPVVNKSADYDFLDTALLIRDNTVSCSIEAGNYNETDVTGINIGTNGTYISASYVVGMNDPVSLSGDELVLTLTVRKTNSSGALIHTSSDSGSQEGDIIQVIDTVTANDIGSASKIWVRLELSIAPSP